MSDFLVDGLTKSVGDKTVFSNVSFIIHSLDRIGIIGVNGTGKTTLLDVISGELGFDGDRSPFSSANDYKIAYLKQEPDFDDSQTILDTVLSSDLREMALIKEYELLLNHYEESKQSRLEKVMAEMDSLDAWSIESEVKTVLSKLGITDLQLSVGELSGGLRRRVQLAQVLLNDADLLLLDEPTNHLDILSREALEDAILSYDGTLIVISHDRYFLNKVINRIVELQEEGTTEYLGNYSYYVEKKLNKLRFEAYEELANGKTKTQLKEEKRKKREVEKEEKAKKLQIKKLEDEISKNEELLLSLQEDLCKEEIYSNPSESERVNKEIRILEEKIEALYMKWEEVNE